MKVDYDAEIERLSKLQPDQIFDVWNHWGSPLFASCVPIKEMYAPNNSNFGSGIGCPSLLKNNFTWSDRYGVRDRLPDLIDPMKTKEIPVECLGAFKQAQMIVDEVIPNRWGD